MKWTVEFEKIEDTEKMKKIFPIRLDDEYFDVFDNSYFFLRRNKIFSLLEIKKLSELYIKDSSPIKNLLEAYVDIIIDTLSFKLDIPFPDVKKVYRGNIKKIKSSLIDESKELILQKELSSGNFFDLYQAYRQIKNEDNRALKYLMCYRLLECLVNDEKMKSKQKKTIDDFIKENNPRVPFVKDKRNLKNKRTLTTYTRNKIHATTGIYLFPYRALISGSFGIEKIVKNAIEGLIQE